MLQPKLLLVFIFSISLLDFILRVCLYCSVILFYIAVKIVVLKVMNVKLEDIGILILVVVIILIFNNITFLYRFRNPN